jgi:hypothetical protein
MKLERKVTAFVPVGIWFETEREWDALRKLVSRERERYGAMCGEGIEEYRLLDQLWETIRRYPHIPVIPQ